MVYNYIVEGGINGLVFNFKVFDLNYYLYYGDYYVNYMGCGNMVDFFN